MKLRLITLLALLLSSLPLGQAAAQTALQNLTTPINVSTATTTKLVSAQTTGTATHVTAYNLFAGGTGNATMEYGTQTTNPCDTGTVALTGIYNMTAQSHLEVGDGNATVLYVPPGNQLCILTSGAVQISGSVAWQQY